jgi:hypothetical protein
LSLADRRAREHCKNNASELDLAHGFPPPVGAEIRSLDWECQSIAVPKFSSN